MTRDEAIKLAVEAGMTCYGCKSEKLGHSWHSYTDNIERFANLVAAKEREACYRAVRGASLIIDGVALTATQTLSIYEQLSAPIRARKP